MTYFTNPVPEGDFDRRYINQELTNISDGIAQITQYIGEVEAVNQEAADLRGSTTLTGVFVTDYAEGRIAKTSDITFIPQLITVDPVAGSITIGRDGLYDVKAYVLQTNGTNNDNYAWSVDVSGSEFLFGSNVWTNAADGFAFSGSILMPLVAGHVLRIEAVDSIATILIDNANLTVQMTERD